MKLWFWIAVFSLGCPASALGEEVIQTAGFGGAAPQNLPEWFTGSDFPSHPVKVDYSNIQPVIIEFDITKNGRMENCTVNQSSGFDLIDMITCKLSERRARFRPANDPDGNPIAVRGWVTIRWMVPGILGA